MLASLPIKPCKREIKLAKSILLEKTQANSTQEMQSNKRSKKEHPNASPAKKIKLSSFSEEPQKCILKPMMPSKRSIQQIAIFKWKKMARMDRTG